MASTAETTLAARQARESAWRMRRSLVRLAWGTAIAAGLYLSAVRIHMSLGNLAGGIPNMLDFFERMFPPELSFFAFLGQATLETVEIAVWGTTLAVVFSIPLSLLAARNTTPNVLVYGATRMLLNLLRSINELIYALLLVSAVGLGPFPGALAIALHATGMLAKFCAEEIEHVDRGPVEALHATGAGRMQIILFAVVPQVLPAVIGYILYRLDVSIRSATVLGLVGAGGLGFSLIKTMKLFKYHQTAACIVAIIVLVFAADWISGHLRKKVL